jgi:hypothetical protein
MRSWQIVAARHDIFDLTTLNRADDGKTLKEVPITTVNARAKLARGLYWKGIDPEVHLGYRKSRRGGVWLVRWRNGPSYRQMPLSTADDFIKEGTLDFNAAVKQALDVLLPAGPRKG